MDASEDPQVRTADQAGSEKHETREMGGVNTDDFSQAETMAAIEASRIDAEPSSSAEQPPSNAEKGHREDANISKKRVKTSTGGPYPERDNTDRNGSAEVHGDNDTVMADVTLPSDSEAASGLSSSSLHQTRKRGVPTQNKDEPAPWSSAAEQAPEDSSAQDPDTAVADSGKGKRDGSAAAMTEARRRSGRRSTRKTYQEESSDAEFELGPAPQSSGKMPPTPRGGNSRIWKPDYLLQDPKSKLAQADISAILKDPRAWTSLSPAQQSRIISLMPDAPTLAPDPADPTASLPNIPQQMLSCNDAFRADISMFQFDLSEGRLEPEWQHDGLVAMERRARGEFDGWKEKEVEAFWGQKQKLSYDVLAGESSKVKLETLIAAGCWEVGDVWVYTRGFGRGKHAVKIEKEATITSITEDNRLVFRMPDGQRKFSSPTAGEDVETEPLDGLQPFADKVIKTDGRIGSWRPVNAWKEIRCFRKNQDIGSPWEIREIYWARQQVD
ncbi:dynein heavy chain-like protein [Diplodia corticola]|uniref:Dynein heavy chain-like protein n=1 Tax=Diplodia corticola TaxID=236234 RepID=A0A1J9R4L3_9PEZI|nr:dynein heavy chain-like protein [Diplodia corticola]OJD36406.1 dynein heavy chain-like protein [Diplodia corticola]